MIRLMLPFREYRQCITDLKDLNINFISSIHSMESVTIPKYQTKFVNAASTRIFEGNQLLAGEAARLVLTETIKKPNKIDSGTTQIPPPHFFREHYTGLAWHIDIKSAYASVYRKHEAETMFNGHRIFNGWNELEPVYQRLKDFKAARNAVPGLMLSSKFAINKGEKRTIISQRSKFYNPNIYNLCNYIMHRIARVAIDNCAALYWNTDGGFVFNPEPLIEIITKYGLRYTIDYGQVKLNYWGCYDFTGKVESLKKGKFINFNYHRHIDNVARF